MFLLGLPKRSETVGHVLAVNRRGVGSSPARGPSELCSESLTHVLFHRDLTKWETETNGRYRSQAEAKNENARSTRIYPEMSNLASRPRKLTATSLGAHLLHQYLPEGLVVWFLRPRRISSRSCGRRYPALSSVRPRLARRSRAAARSASRSWFRCFPAFISSSAGIRIHPLATLPGTERERLRIRRFK